MIGERGGWCWCWCWGGLAAQGCLVRKGCETDSVLELLFSTPTTVLPVKMLLIASGTIFLLCFEGGNYMEEGGRFNEQSGVVRKLEE